MMPKSLTKEKTAEPSASAAWAKESAERTVQITRVVPGIAMG